MKRKIVAIISVLIIGICNLAYAVSIPDATSNFFVNDFAGIFSDEDIRIMMEKAIDLDQNYNGIQVVVTTVKTIGNEELEVYANRMYNQYEIGQDDMGVLLLVVTEDRLIRAETGDMMQTYITDSRMGKLMDEYAIPYLRENKFAKGMLSFQDAVISEIKKKVVVEADDANAVAATVSTPIVNDGFNESAPVTNTANIASNVMNESVEEVAKGESGNVLGIIISVIVGIGLVVATIIFTRRENRKFKEFADKQVELAKEEASQIFSSCTELKNQLGRAQNDAKQKAQQLEKYKNQAASDEKKIQELTTQLEQVREKYSQTQQQLQACEKRLEQARTVCPDIDGQIDAWIAEQKKQADMSVAESFDSYAVKRLELISSIENLEFFKNVLDKYQALTEAQRSYVKTDICIFENKYDKALKLKKEKEARLAYEAELREAEALKREIESELAHNIVPERNYCDKLQRLMRKYNSLSNAVRGIFAITLINQFSRRIEEANFATEAEEQRRYEEEQRRRREEEERRRREEEERRRRQREEEERRRREEERRRRQRMMSSSSGSRSRSSFGGFSGRGGRSSGGGASGRF